MDLHTKDLLCLSQEDGDLSSDELAQRHVIYVLVGPLVVQDTGVKRLTISSICSLLALL